MKLVSNINKTKINDKIQIIEDNNITLKQKNAINKSIKCYNISENKTNIEKDYTTNNNLNKQINVKKNKNITTSNNKLPKFDIESVNIKFKDIVKTNNPINKDDIQIIDIKPDGNCYYISISFFLLSSQEFYEDIKNLIINWIENNYDKYLQFFVDDDNKQLSKEEIAEEEWNDIKSKNSWGSFYTIEISCLLFNLSIGVYIKDNNNTFRKYFYIENNKQDTVNITLTPFGEYFFLKF